MRKNLYRIFQTPKIQNLQYPHLWLDISDISSLFPFFFYETDNSFVFVFFQLDLVPSVCACLAEVPDELVDKITQNSLVSMETFPLGMMVHCHLVGKGKQPLTWLNRCIDILLSPAIR